MDIDQHEDGVVEKYGEGGNATWDNDIEEVVRGERDSGAGDTKNQSACSRGSAARVKNQM